MQKTPSASRRRSGSYPRVRAGPCEILNAALFTVTSERGGCEGHRPYSRASTTSCLPRPRPTSPTAQRRCRLSKSRAFGHLARRLRSGAPHVEIAGGHPETSGRARGLIIEAEHFSHDDARRGKKTPWRDSCMLGAFRAAADEDIPALITAGPTACAKPAARFPRTRASSDAAVQQDGARRPNPGQISACPRLRASAGRARRAEPGRTASVAARPWLLRDGTQQSGSGRSTTDSARPWRPAPRVVVQALQRVEHVAPHPRHIRTDDRGPPRPLANASAMRAHPFAPVRAVWGERSAGQQSAIAWTGIGGSKRNGGSYSSPREVRRISHPRSRDRRAALRADARGQTRLTAPGRGPRNTRNVAKGRPHGASCLELAVRSPL